MTDPTKYRLELEGLYARGALSRGQFIAGLTALGLSFSSIEALAGTQDSSVAEAAGPVARYLVLMVLDAFRPDYMSLASMPALAALARSGTSYEAAWVGQIESFTPTGHATIATGCLPKHTGILGFEWRDPASLREVLDGWPPGVEDGALERDLRASGVDSIALALKRSDRSARVVAVSSEKIYAADAIGGYAADYILHYQKNRQNTMLTPAAVPGHAPPATFFQRPQLMQHWPLTHVTDWDYLSTLLAIEAVDEFRPRALLINLPSADYYGHPYGGPVSPTVFAQVTAGIDRNIARIVQAYKDAGIYDQTLFVVTADHGMVPNTHTLDGALTKSVVRQAGGEYQFHTGGTAAYIYIRNHGKAPAVARAMAEVPNVTGAYYLLEKGTKYYYDRARVGTIDPALDAAHHFLMGTFVGPRAPDVVVPFRENTIDSKHSSAYGQHGGLNWGAQHVPLIFSGPGVNPDRISPFPARLVDIAPTVMRLMGLSGRPMDGLVLADGLTAATALDITGQIEHARTSGVVQAALFQQSANNLAEDISHALTPPPPRPPHA